MRIAKKSTIIFPLLLIVIVFLFIILGMRVKLYNDYLNSLEKIKFFNDAMAHHGALNYEGELQKNAIVYDGHLYFSVDAPYHLTHKNKRLIEYRYKDEWKGIVIHVAEFPVDRHYVKEVSDNTGLDKAKVENILDQFKFTDDIDALLYAIDQENQKKLSIVSSQEQIEEAIVLNGSISQYLQKFMGPQSDSKTMNVITGNVDGFELMDRTIHITNGQHAYFITFVGNYTDAEVEQFMKTVHIQ